MELAGIWGCGVVGLLRLGKVGGIVVLCEVISGICWHRRACAEGGDAESLLMAVCLGVWWVSVFSRLI